MIGIYDYSFILGRYLKTVEDIAGVYCSSDELSAMHDIGLEKICTDNEIYIDEMIHRAFNKIAEKPDIIFIAHSLPFITANGHNIMPYVNDIPVMRLSGLPCVILHRAVMTAVKMVQAGIYKTVLVIGADKAYSDRERIFFGTIMGDSAIALLIKNGCEHNQILASHIATHIIAPYGENSSDEGIRKFRAVNVQMMRQAMQECLLKAKLEAVDYYVTHTSNCKFWDAVSALCKIPREKFLDGNIKNTGHLNSNDSFVHYFHWCAHDIIKDGETAMLINPGFGGSQGCTLIRR